MNDKRIVENLDIIKFNINNVDHENKTLSKDKFNK